MFINELKLPFEKSLKVAKDIGAEYVWISRIPDWPEIADLTDKQVDIILKLIMDCHFRVVNERYSKK